MPWSTEFMGKWESSWLQTRVVPIATSMDGVMGWSPRWNREVIPFYKRSLSVRWSAVVLCFGIAPCDITKSAQLADGPIGVVHTSLRIVAKFDVQLKYLDTVFFDWMCNLFAGAVLMSHSKSSSSILLTCILYEANLQSCLLRFETLCSGGPYLTHIWITNRL